MQAMRRWLGRLWRGEDGSPAVEFAFAAPAVVLMVIGTIEVGLVLFVSILMESGLRDAARFAITGREVEGMTRIERIVQIIDTRTFGLVTVGPSDVEALVYPSFAAIGGEDFVDGNGNGQYDGGETFTDDNGNGQWDSNISGTGAGGAGEVVVYTVRHDWALLTPFAGTVLGENGVIELGASLAVRNEPWDEDET